MSIDPRVKELLEQEQRRINTLIMRRVLFVGCAFFLVTAVIMVFVAQLVSHLLHCPWWLAYLPLVLITWVVGVLWARGNPNQKDEA